LDPLSYLFSLEQFGIKFGLDNISTLVARLGHPERAFRSIHIAGTNGKGSVTAMVDAAIRAAGHRSARYTSPHLIDLSERFVIDGRPVAREALVEAVADVRNVVEALRTDGSLTVHPTFFEVTTAVAFELFKRAGVDTAVLEVGLGGRLDSTNVVSPIATAITSIALDHEQYLGSTLGEIAFEKAGIIKPGVPVVVGDLAPEAAVVIERIARERGAEMIRASMDAAAPFRIGLAGRHQVANAAIAVRVLDVLSARGVAIPASAIASGLAEPGWPGRLDLRRLPGGRELLLDAAHNPAGAASLASYLRERQTRLPLVFAAMRDKNIAGILAELAPAVGSLVVTRASNPRSADPSVIAEQARVLAPSLAVSTESSPALAVAAAWRQSPAIVVAGSIFLLGDVMREVGVS
jgi:dihydrofolate synthase / folylpolyglutamate synthase